MKSFIMDNSVLVGVGNIYAAESLFAARIHPLTPADRVGKKEYERLLDEIRRVLAAAIEAGGSTIADYHHVDGSEGKFARELKVYGRAGMLCPACRSPIGNLRIGGRSSCFCPTCQKKK